MAENKNSEAANDYRVSDAALRIALAAMVCALAFGLATAVYQLPPRGKTLIQILRVFLSWPAVVMILALTFATMFRTEFAKFISDVAEIAFPGGKISRNQLSAEPGVAAAAASAAATPEARGVVLNEAQIAEVASRIEALTAKVQDAEKQKQELLNTATKMLLEEQHKAIFWWHNYLNVFLVPTTKQVLAWFSTQPIPVTTEYYEEHWKSTIKDAAQRQTILHVLLQFTLLQREGSAVKIGDNGKRFLNFLGAFPK